MSFSVIVPTRDMRKDLELLLASFESSGLAKTATEIIVVDDGSVDGTTDFLRARANQWPNLKVIVLNPSQGRFSARLKGAQAASTDSLLFVDTRIKLPPDFSTNLQKLMRTHQEIMGVPFIDEKKSIYNLYWDRTHQIFFRQHFADAKKGFSLTTANFEDYTKGTGLLLLRKDKFLEVSAKISSTEAKFSDDNLVMKGYVQQFPIFVSDQCSFIWEPRQDFGGFMSRLFERGQNFAYNHWFAGRTRFTLLSEMGIAGALLLLVGLFLATGSALLAIAIVLLLMAASVIFFARWIGEAIRLAPLHLACLIIFGVGAFSTLFYKKTA